MHSLVLSQCSEIPHKLSSDIQELLRSWATICTGASSCQYWTIEWYIFACPGLSQYTLKRSLLLKAALHVLPRQNRPRTNLNRGPFKNHEKDPNIEPCGTPERTQKKIPPPTQPPSSVSSRQDLPRSQCSLEKMSLVGRSRHDYKTQAREELWFELTLSFSSH